MSEVSYALIFAAAVISSLIFYILFEKSKAEEQKNTGANINPLENILRLNKIAFWEYQIDGHLVTCNEETYKLLAIQSTNYSPNFLEFLSFFPNNERAIIQNAIDHTLKNDFSSVEISMLRNSGHIQYLSLKLESIKNSEGKIIFILGIFQDITDQKEKENQTQLVLNKLESKNLELINLNKEIAEEKYLIENNDRLKSTFISNISQEMRVPINGIHGFITMLNDVNTTPAEKNSFMTVIDKSCSTLLNTANDLLELSRIDSGEYAINQKSFNPTSMLEKLYFDFKPLFDKKNIELNLVENVEAKNITIFSDEEKLQKTLSCFLANSLKFTTKGHTKFGIKIRSSLVEFFVQDTGIGISPEFQPYLFDRFYQVNPIFSRGYNGAGLGLSIVKGLAGLLHGKISIDSKINAGSIFSLTIPYNSKKASDTNSGSDSNYKWNNKTILVVEDDPHNFRLVEVILKERTNAKVIHAENGLKALEIFKANPDISLVLMDLNMPIMDGFESTRQLRALDLKLPIIALSAFAGKDAAEKAATAGFNDYIIKPFDIGVLLTTLKEYIKA